MDDGIVSELIEAAGEICQGDHFNHFIVPGISGGAGTSINMNVNEIIANVSLVSMGRKPGEYGIIDPIEHANVFQSTNDVIPTSLKVATMFLLQDLEAKINELRFVVEQQENTHQERSPHWLYPDAGGCAHLLRNAFQHIQRSFITRLVACFKMF